MESWMITTIVSVVGLVGNAAVLKYIVSKQGETLNTHTDAIALLTKFINENRPLLLHLSKEEDAVRGKLSEHASDISTLKEKIATAPSLEEVWLQFVTKELHSLSEKALHDKIETLNTQVQSLFRTALDLTSTKGD